MRQDNSILDKVYDAYADDDWEFAKDNLNPMREINPTDTMELNDLRKAAMLKIQARVDEIAEKTIGKQTKDSQVTTNAGGNGAVPDSTLAEALAKGRTGGWDQELDDMLARIAALKAKIGDVYPDASDPRFPNYKEPVSLVDNLRNLYSMDCEFNLLKKYVTSSTSGSGSGDGAGGNGSSGSGNKNKSEAELEKDQGTSTDPTSAITPEQATGGGGVTPPEVNLPDAAETAACGLRELEWLQIFLVVVKIITTFTDIVNTVIGIIIMVINIVQLAVGAWLNPANIAKIVQIILQQVMSLIQYIIAILIQYLWDLLNLDCIGAYTLSLINAIKQALQGYKDMMYAFDACAVSILDTLGEGLAKAIDDMVNTCIETYGSKNWNDMLKDVAGAGSEFGKTMSSGEFWSDAALEALPGTAMDVYNGVQDIIAMFSAGGEGTTNLLANSSDGTPFGATAQAAARMAANFTNIGGNEERDKIIEENKKAKETHAAEVAKKKAERAEKKAQRQAEKDAKASTE